MSINRSEKIPWGRSLLSLGSGAYAATGCQIGGLIVMAVGLVMIEDRGTTSASTIDRSNLRMVVQASAIHAADKHGQLPEAENVHDYAVVLARNAGLNDAWVWVAAERAPSPTDRGRTDTVWDHERQEMHPAFRARASDWAVVSGLRDSMPSQTPVAWTRGLLPSGYWAKDSLYGGEGGHIAFLGGNVSYFKDLHENGGALRRFDGTGPTADVHEALPPEARILNNDAGTETGLRWGGERVKKRVRETMGMIWVLWWVGGFVFLTWYHARRYLGIARPWTRTQHLLYFGVPMGLLALGFFVG